MDRREAIRRAALLVGGTLTASTLFALTEGCNTHSNHAAGLEASGAAKAASSGSAGPAFLTPDQQTLVNEFAETILPATSTPGAKEAGVGDFINVMLRDCYSKADQTQLLDGIASFQQECKTRTGKSFADLASNDRAKFMTGIESQIYKKPVNDKPTISDDHNVNTKKNTPQDEKKQEKTKNEPYHYYKVLKELTLIGYFQSEIGCTKALSYVKVPGMYQGSVKLKPGQKAWAQG